MPSCRVHKEIGPLFLLGMSFSQNNLFKTVYSFYIKMPELGGHTAFVQSNLSKMSELNELSPADREAAAGTVSSVAGLIKYKCTDLQTAQNLHLRVSSDTRTPTAPCATRQLGARDTRFQMYNVHCASGSLLFRWESSSNPGCSHLSRDIGWRRGVNLACRGR